MTQPEEHAKGEIVPAVDFRKTLRRCDPHQKYSAKEICDNCDANGARDQSKTA